MKLQHWSIPALLAILFWQDVSSAQLSPGHAMPSQGLEPAPPQNLPLIHQQRHESWSADRGNPGEVQQQHIVDNYQELTWNSTDSLQACETCNSSCSRVGSHRTGWFGDLLYLTAWDVDQAYATHVDGPITAPVPVAPTSVVDSSYQTGFRIGHISELGDKSSLRATYWYYQSDADDSLNLPGGTGWIHPEVTHPDTLAG